MSLEIGQRVVFRSLQWEVADTSSETLVELFGLSEENRGCKIKVLLGLDGGSIELAQIPVVLQKEGQSCKLEPILLIKRNLLHGHFHPVQMASFPS